MQGLLSLSTTWSHLVSRPTPSVSPQKSSCHPWERGHLGRVPRHSRAHNRSGGGALALTRP
jgi:hypothetical protein